MDGFPNKVRRIFYSGRIFAPQKPRFPLQFASQIPLQSLARLTTAVNGSLSPKKQAVIFAAASWNNR
jgi:hypothetical protein